MGIFWSSGCEWYSLFCISDELSDDAKAMGAWKRLFEDQGWGPESRRRESHGGSGTGGLFCLAEESFLLESKGSSNQSAREHF